MMDPKRSPLRRLVVTVAALSCVLVTSPAAARRFPHRDVACVDALLSLVKQRLVIAEQVARAKWNERRAIDDPSREQQLIRDVTASAEEYALDPRVVASFFQGQIEASKLVQRRLFAEWSAADLPPFEHAASLEKDLRPQLDRLTTALLHGLSAALPALTRPGGEQLLRARVAIVLADTHAEDAVLQAALSPLQAACR